MLNKNDLRIIPYEPGLLTYITSRSFANLKQLIEEWLKIPELRCSTSDLANYEFLDKAGIIYQMTEVDWPTGLTTYQVCQMKRMTFMNSKRKHWSIIRLSGKMNRGLDLVDIKLGMEKYLSLFYHSCVCGTRDPSSGIYLFTLSIADRRKTNPSFTDYTFGCMIYYVESNLLVTGEYALNKSNDSQFKEAVLGTFSANKMHIEPISDPSIDSMNYFAQYKTSEAVFAGFSKNGLDSNPLDIRQKRHIAFDEPRATNEEKKRIVPMDLEKIEKRFDNVGEDFTWKTLTGHKKVQIDLHLPLNSGHTIPLTDYVNNDIEITMTMFGNNVGEGIKVLMDRGKMEKNPPTFMKGIAVSSAKNLLVNSEGVSKEVKEIRKHRFV